MKVIGLISEYCNVTKFSLPYNNYKKRVVSESKQLILEYLKNEGIPFATTMHIIKSLEINDNKILGGIIYYTDGNWIWPNYLCYYLENFDIEIPVCFIEYLKENDKKNVQIDTERAIVFLKDNKIL